MNRRKRSQEPTPAKVTAAPQPKEGWLPVGRAYEGRKRPVMIDLDYTGGQRDGTQA